MAAAHGLCLRPKQITASKRQREKLHIPCWRFGLAFCLNFAFEMKSNILLEELQTSNTALVQETS